MRTSRYRVFIAAFLLLILPNLGTAQTDQLSLSDFGELESKVVSVVNRCMSASVGLGSKERPENGSAVVVTKDGLLLTAYHVVEGLPDDNMLVSFVDGKTVRAKKLGGVPKLDIAVAQIIDEGEYPFVEIGDMSTVENGDWCVSISHAGGFQSDRTPPVRLGRVVDRINPGGFLQMSSTLIGGDSGGPTFDLDGKVIGIHSNIGGSLNQNQACPISDFTKKDHWQRLLDGEVWGKPGEDAKKKKDKKSKGKDGDESDKPDQDKDAEDADSKDADSKDADSEDTDSEDTDPEDTDPKDADSKDEDTSTEPEVKSAEPQESDTETKENPEATSPEQEPSAKPEDEKPSQEKPKKEDQPKEKKFETKLDAFREITEQYRHSVVRFWRGKRMICSGLILTQDGIIVTKSSELRTSNFEIELPDGELVSGKVLKRVKDNDLLFVKVDRQFESTIQINKWSDKEIINTLPLGSIVVAVGFGGEPTAIGVKSVELRNLAQSGYAVLGVQLGNQQNDLTIKSLSPDSAAQKAGLLPGDKITKIGGEEIETLDQLREKLRSLKPNSRLPVEFEREGRAAASLVKLGSSNARNDKAAQNYPQGGRLSRKRVQFTEALQSDTPFDPKHAGGPLLDIQGRMLGLNIARAGRIKSYTLPAHTISKELDTLKTTREDDPTP